MYESFIRNVLTILPTNDITDKIFCIHGDLLKTIAQRDVT